MATLVNNLGIICLAIDSNDDHSLSGRTKLQKMIYFSRYLNWDIDPYRLHFYGPYSNEIADSLHIATDSEVVEETTPTRGPYQYVLSDKGNDFLRRFLTEVCDQDKITKTKTLFASLNEYSKEQLELTATIDYVSNNNPRLNRNQIIQKVSVIKENFSLDSIEEAYAIWLEIQQTIRRL